MPISTTANSVLLPFVNNLEKEIEELSVAVEDWTKNKNTVLNMSNELSTINYRVTSALGQASNALSEIGNATVGVSATTPNKLKTLIENLKKEMVSIAESTEGLSGGGGGAGAYDARINSEIDNALASVDETIPEGLKLDYRLRQLQELAASGGGGGGSMKDIVFPYMTDTLSPVNSLVYPVPQSDEIIFVEGDVTVLDENLSPIYTASGTVITGRIDEYGMITFNEYPDRRVKLYYPVEMQFENTPKEFLMVFLDLVLTKNSNLYKSIAVLTEEMGDIAQVLKAMQGKDWTSDYSIMRNQQELIKESITPKGLNITVDQDKVHMTFSYSDHEHLSHFIGEVYNDDTGKWEPYNGTDGIISK